VKQSLRDDPQSLKFLGELGLGEPDFVDDVVVHVLPKYKDPKELQEVPMEYEHDLRRIISAYGTDSIKRQTELVAQLKEHSFVYCQRADGGAQSLRVPAEA